MAFYSPLRYPGGKGKIADFFYGVFEDNNLCDGTYVEPYAGGASVALALLYNEYASNIIINDYDRSIYAFWRCVLNKTDELCSLIAKTKIDIKTRETCREIQSIKTRAKILDLGFSTFFLNRTNHSGIIRGGVIGGKNQTGKWKIDARFNKDDLIERIQRIGSYRNRIKLFNLDTIVLLNKLSSDFTEKTLCYLDPPYYEKGQALYVNYYVKEDHLEVAKKVKSLKKIKWIVSYDNNKEIKKMYCGCKRIEYGLNYSVARASQGSEVMFFSKGLKITNSIRLCS